MPNARAQSTPAQTAAEALFKQGRDLVAAGRYAEACPKLAESQRLDPAPGTLLNLATCYEKNSQLASAWVTYKEAAAAAQSADQQDRARLARRKAGELEGKFSTLTIVVPAPADRPDLQVKCDGDLIGRPGWGSPIPVDPGAHVVEASAPGRKTWQGRTQVDAAAAVQASLEVPPLEALPEPPPLPASTATAASPPGSQATGAGVESRVEQQNQPSGSRGSGQRALGFVVGGVGLAGLVTGAVFGLVAKSDNDNAKSHCLTDQACDPQGLSSTTSAQHAATYSTIGFAAGGALLATGLVLWLTAPSDDVRASQRWGISPLVGAGTGGAVLRRSW